MSLRPTFSRSRFKIENSEIVAQALVDGSISNSIIRGAVAIEGDGAKVEVINSLVKAFASSSQPEASGLAMGIKQLDDDLFLKRSVVSVASSVVAIGVGLGDPAGASKLVIEDSKVIVKAENIRSSGVAIDNGDSIFLLDSLISASSESIDGRSVGIEVGTLEPDLVSQISIRNSVIFGGSVGIIQDKSNLAIRRSTLVNGLDSQASGVSATCLLTDDGKGALLNSDCHK